MAQIEYTPNGFFTSGSDDRGNSMRSAVGMVPLQLEFLTVDQYPQIAKKIEGPLQLQMCPRCKIYERSRRNKTGKKVADRCGGIFYYGFSNTGKSNSTEMLFKSPQLPNGGPPEDAPCLSQVSFQVPDNLLPSSSK